MFRKRSASCAGQLFTLSSIYRFPERKPPRILIGYYELCSLKRVKGPVDLYIRIVVLYPAFILRMIKIGSLIFKFGIFGQHKKAMGKALRDKELLLVFLREPYTEPLSEGF